jgi:hypothetical protein
VHDVPNEAFCRFDYLDPQDGAVVQVIHTGTDKIGVEGTLRGIRKRVLLRSVTKKDETKYSEAGSGSRLVGKIVSIVIFLLGLTFVLLALLLRPSPDEPKGQAAGFLIGGVFIIGGILAYRISYLMPPTILNTQITTIDPKKHFLSGVFRTLRKQK